MATTIRIKRKRKSFAIPLAAIGAAGLAAAPALYVGGKFLGATKKALKGEMGDENLQ